MPGSPPLWEVNWQQVDGERKRAVPTHSYTAGSKPAPCPHQSPHQNACFPSIWGRGGWGRDLHDEPTSVQLLDPPQFSVSVFPLTPQEVQKETNENSKRQNLNHPPSSFLSHTLKEAFPLHTFSAEERGAMFRRPGQWQGMESSLPFLCTAPPSGSWEPLYTLGLHTSL